jgi:hypothetical protein
MRMIAPVYESLEKLRRNTNSIYNGYIQMKP